MDQPVRDKFLVFGAPEVRQEDIDEVVASLKSGWWGTGPKVMQFERDFAAYKGVDETQVAAVNSCTAALHVSLIAAGIGPGDEVISTPMTFCATINSIIHCGATPVLADIDPVTMNIDPVQIEVKISDKTKAISLVILDCSANITSVFGLDFSTLAVIITPSICFRKSCRTSCNVLSPILFIIS